MTKQHKTEISVLTLAFLFNIIACYSQVTDLNTIKTKFNQYIEQVPNEVVYVQTDRDEYIAGEEFWFNISLFDRKSSKPSTRSKIVYVEILNSDNTPVAQKRIGIASGFGPGHLTLPDSLTTGTYTLRAYTSWMKNFMPENCFMKDIDIYNYLNNKVLKEGIRAEIKPRRKVNITYFPEGGKLLIGNLTKIAVRVTDEYDRGLDFKAIVRDEKGDSVTMLVTGVNGIGLIELTPSEGGSYNINVDNDRDNYISFLPSSFPSGFGLNVNNSDNQNLEVSLISDQDWREKTGSFVNLLIQTNGNISWSATNPLTGNNTRVNIPKSTLIPGVNQLTVFNPSGSVVCERLFYIPEKNKPELTITTVSEAGLRSKMVFDIGCVNASLSNLTVAVASDSGVDSGLPIDEYLLFGTEFGEITKLTGGRALSDLSSTEIDDWLLTVKSNRINWQKIFAGDTEMQYPFEETDHYISGKLEVQNSTSAEKVLFLSIPGKDAVFQSAVTDKNGNFTFKLGINEFLNDLIIQPAEIDKKTSIRIITPFSDKYMNIVKPAIQTTKPIPSYISQWSVNYQVGKIFSQSPVGITVNRIADTIKPLRYYGKPDKELVMSDYIALPVMSEVFFELLPGVFLKNNKSNYSFSIIDPVAKKELDYSPTLMIDGVIIDDAAMIANLDPLLVEKIDVVKTEYVVGDLIFYGIINVITKKGDLSSIVLPDYAMRIPYRVYSSIPEFISPVYKSEIQSKNRIPDFRNTVFWNPGIIPDSNGKASIEIWSSDYASPYEINIQGITKDGRTFSEKKTITIK